MEFEMDHFLSVPPSRNGSPTHSRRTTANGSALTSTPPRQPSLASLGDSPPCYRSASLTPSTEGNMPYQHLDGSPATSFSVLGAKASPALSETSFDFGRLEEQPLVSASGRRHARSESLESDAAATSPEGWSRRKKAWTAAAVLLGLAAATGAGVTAYLKLGRHEQGSASKQGGGQSTASLLYPGTTAMGTSTASAAPSSSTLKTNGWTSDMVYPSGFPGTGLNGRLGSSKPNAKPVYAQLLAFGSSYSDNGHHRAAQLARSNSPQGYWQNRWSDGPVWVEYLSQLLAGSAGASVPLLNYAYGGATTDNAVTNSGVPDTGEQIAAYLGEHAVRNTKSLVALFTSTNSVSMIMQAYTHPGNPLYHDDPAAFAALTQSARSLFTQLRWLVPNGTGTVSPDFLVLPIMPLDLTSRGQYLATSANEKIEVIRNFTRAYNQVMMEEAQKLAAELGARGQVFTYDFPSLMYSIVAQPQRYAIANATEGCFFVQCKNPEQHVFWDNLHLVTSMHKQVAAISAEIVLSSA